MTKRYAFRQPAKAASEKVPRVARLLALAHKFQKMLDSGEVESMAELARLGRVSRARITQIMDLLMLAPDIQEEVLFGEWVTCPPALGALLGLAHQLGWLKQRAAWTAAGYVVARPHGVVLNIVAPCRRNTKRGRA